MKVLTITAKCSDMFCGVLSNNGHYVGEHNGYVPAFFPGGDSDYVEMRIDVDTGRILNWKKPTAAQLAETFRK